MHILIYEFTNCGSWPLGYYRIRQNKIETVLSIPLNEHELAGACEWDTVQFTSLAYQFHSFLMFF